MDVLHDDLYNYPAYYDLIFGAEWKEEFRFLQGCFERHAHGSLKRIFEPACGTGRLLYRLARAGYEVSGLDLNPQAVNYCQRRLQRHRLSADVWVGDMSDFRLETPVDLAFNLINSFRHLETEATAVAHLRCVSECLRPGGLYLLGLHLTPTEGQPLEEERWTASRGRVRAECHLVTTGRDLAGRLETISVTLDVKTPRRKFRVEDEFRFRIYTAAQMQWLVEQAPTLEWIASYDFTYGLDSPVTLSPDLEDLILVLRKREPAGVVGG